MRVALVHDHLIQSGGAEKVLEAMGALYPTAPIHTLLYDARVMDRVFGHRDIRTSYLQSIPFAHRFARYLLPLMPSATESYAFDHPDVILSSSSAFAKGIVVPEHAMHISYCHTPTRYLWTDSQSYIAEQKAPAFVKKALPVLLSHLRTYDRLSAERVDHFIANSKTVQARIKRYYQKESTVLYPPVETERFYTAERVGSYFLTGGRLVSYKRFDLTIKAFNKLGLPLVIFGSGPLYKDLRALAKSNIEFVGSVSDSTKAELYAKALAFIHPQEEDFGITVVESMASGRPVIAYKKGGATESIVEGTGSFFDVQTHEDIADAVYHFKPEQFDPKRIRAHAETFSVARFQQTLKERVEHLWQAHKERKSHS